MADSLPGPACVEPRKSWSSLREDSQLRAVGTKSAILGALDGGLGLLSTTVR
jgi:hypothetical protein